MPVQRYTRKIIRYTAVIVTVWNLNGSVLALFFYRIKILSMELHNILNEQFNPERPNAVWCTDITYIWTQDGFAYLNCVMDLYARKIIAWTLADTMEVSTVIETINKAKACRNTDLPLIIHSDRGSQYVSNAWR